MKANTILMVEDDQVDQMAFCRMMKGQRPQYDFFITSSVAETLRALSSRMFDVVVTDYRLADGVAFDILQAVRDLPAIIVTGAGNEGIAVEALRAGAHDYLVKDANRKYLDLLPIVIDKAIAHRAAEQELKDYHENLETLVAKRTEELASEKEMLGTTLAGMTEGVMAIGLNGEVTLLNKVAEQLTGWKFKEACGRPIDEVLCLVDEKTQTALKHPITYSHDGSVVEEVPDCCVLCRGRDSRVSVHVSAAPIRKPGGNITGQVIVLRDVSEARRVDRMKKDFVSSVSHELRTPLTSIKAFTATILRDPGMSDQTRNEFLRIIDSESNRLAHLIDNLLEISRVESGSVQITSQPVSLSHEIAKVLPALQPLAESKGIELISHVQADLPDLEADPDKIHSLLTNLVGNAVKFTPAGGRVHVTCTCESDEVALRVEDTGIGIPHEDLARIFDRFYRVCRPGNEITGTGLGLAIVKEIVEAHKWKLTVDSTEGKGTVFTVCLPLPQGYIQVGQADRSSAGERPT